MEILSICICIGMAEYIIMVMCYSMACTQYSIANGGKGWQCNGVTHDNTHCALHNVMGKGLV